MRVKNGVSGNFYTAQIGFYFWLFFILKIFFFLIDGFLDTGNERIERKKERKKERKRKKEGKKERKTLWTTGMLSERRTLWA